MQFFPKILKACYIISRLKPWYISTIPAKIGVTNLLEIARNLKPTGKTISLYTKCICGHQKIEDVH